MKTGKAKLISAALLLVLSLVILVTASVAWMTASTNPEIGGMQVSLYTRVALLVSDSENGEYVQAISLGDSFKYYAPLKPVSTADGVNWFLPSYDTAKGSLKDPSEFILDNTLAHGNVMVYDYDKSSNAYTAKTGVALYEAQNNGYYVYTDFWIMSQQEGGCKVTLSIPANIAGLDTWETEQGLYGSYALASYEASGDGVASIDNNAQTALRIGFLTKDNGFIVYEPNADQRSDLAKKPKADTQPYVSGYKISANGDNYQSGYYIPTNPIALDTNGGGKLGVIPQSKLIIQRAGEWDLTKLKAALLAGDKPNSTHVAQFGQFVADNSLLSADETGMAAISADNLAAGSDTVIVSLEENVPQRVRMFIWLEGQDVDCWNDIAAGSFTVNLEFAAQP